MMSTVFQSARIRMPSPLRSGRDSVGWPARYTSPSRNFSWSICSWPSRWRPGKRRPWSIGWASITPSRPRRSSGGWCNSSSRTSIFALNFIRKSCLVKSNGRSGTGWTDPSWSGSRSPWTASWRCIVSCAWPRRRRSAFTGTGSWAGKTGAVRAPGEGRDTIVGVRKDEAATTSAELRAHNLARLLRAIHDSGGQLTRAELTRQLSLARGTATVLVRDLAGRRLIEELTSPVDATVQRARGRPTGIPSAHADGPVALAVDLRDDSFTVAAFELTGRCTG